MRLMYSCNLFHSFGRRSLFHFTVAITLQNIKCVRLSSVCDYLCIYTVSMFECMNRCLHACSQARVCICARALVRVHIDLSARVNHVEDRIPSLYMQDAVDACIRADMTDRQAHQAQQTCGQARET
jgi:hypothetical protein